MLKEEARKLKVKLKFHAESGCGVVREVRRPDSTSMPGGGGVLSL